MHVAVANLFVSTFGHTQTPLLGSFFVSSAKGKKQGLLTLQLHYFECQKGNVDFCVKSTKFLAALKM